MFIFNTKCLSSQLSVHAPRLWHEPTLSWLLFLAQFIVDSDMRSSIMYPSYILHFSHEGRETSKNLSETLVLAYCLALEPSVAARSFLHVNFYVVEK